MGILDGEIASSIYAGFKGKLLSGLIRQRAVPDSGALDDRGDPIDIATTETMLEGFYEDYDASYLARSGLPQDSVKVNIFAKSCPDVTPGRDDLVKLTRAGVEHWFQLRRVRTDPAVALWECIDAFAIPEPESAP